MKLDISLDAKSVDIAMKKLTAYKNKLSKRANMISGTLAELGEFVADSAYMEAGYDGDIEYSVTRQRKKSGQRIIASGATVLFLEFGAGITFGYGHPLNEQFGMGPGTYNPDSDNWKNPDGWVFDYHGEKVRTLGNAPTMAMYNTAQLLRKRIEPVAKEVFAEK